MTLCIPSQGPIVVFLSPRIHPDRGGFGTERRPEPW